MDTKKPITHYLPGIAAAVIIVGILLYALVSKLDLGSSSTSEVTAAKTPAPTSTPLPAPSQSAVPTATPSDAAASNANQSAPVNVSPTADVEKNKQKGAELREQLNDFLQDTAKEQGSRNRTKWSATKDKSFYADIDSDGLEDAVFTFTAAANESDNIWKGFVVFKNTPEKYVYVGDYYFGALDQIDILSFDVQTGGIKLRMKEYEESTMGEDEDSINDIPSKMVNKTFVIRDNRLQQK